MDESASPGMQHAVLGGGFARLAIRPKDNGAGRAEPTTDTDAPSGATGTARTTGTTEAPREPDETRQEDDAAPWAVVTRRTNSQQIRQLVLPPSQYAQLPRPPPPIAMFATGDAVTAASSANDTVDNDYGNDYGNDDDDDVHVYEEIAALRTIARASARSHRNVRRPHHAVRGSSGSGSGSGRPTPFPLPPSMVAPAVLPTGLGLGTSMEMGLEMAMAVRARLQLPFPAAASFPANRTLAGRVGKPETGRFRRPVLMRQHRPPAMAAAQAARTESALRLSRRAPSIIHPRLVLATILALPGFDFGFGEEQQTGADADLTTAATQLARVVLGHPAARRRCGRSPHRRGVARFLVLLLTFPLVAHHGKAVFEQTCGGYTPGDEHRPAFWAQYAVGFATWLGLVDGSGGGGGGGGGGGDGSSSGFTNDPFLGGKVLHTLVMRLGEGRRRFLERKEQQQRAESLLPPASSSSASQATTENKDADVSMGVDDDDLDAAASAVNDSTDLFSLVTRLRQAHRNTLLPVCKAVDAWLLFVARRRSEDLDPALLAELSLD